MFSRPKTEIGPDCTLILALLQFPFGATTKDISEQLGVSLSTASRRLAAARDEEWLATPDMHGRPVPTKGETARNTRWLLNLSRPGADALLEYLYIAHGADVSTYRQRLADPYGHHDRTFEDHLLHQTSGPSDLDKIRATLSGIHPWLHPRTFRAFAAQIRHLWLTPTRLEAKAHKLYTQNKHPEHLTDYPPRHAERYRDLIHQMQKLATAMPSLPEDPAQGEDARPHLVALAHTAENIARILAKAADFYTASDALGFQQHKLAAYLADYQQQQFDNTPGHRTTVAAADQHLSSYTELKQRISAGYPLSPNQTQPFLRDGGTPAPFELGTAGESFIALELRTQAETALTIRDQILALEGMTEALETARKILD